MKEMNRLHRAENKLYHDFKRQIGREQKSQQPEQEPDQVILRGIVDNRGGVTKHLVHGYTFEFGVDANLNPHQLRSQLVRRLRSKGNKWRLERQLRGSGAFEWLIMIIHLLGHAAEGWLASPVTARSAVGP
jgi:hypothetical protein